MFQDPSLDRALVFWHLENSQKMELAEYVGRYRRQIAQGLSRTRTVYLDTNYWVWLRQAELGSGSPQATRLLDTLRSMVRSRELICATQFISFSELGQQEETSLRVTARLLDELTEGLCVAQVFDLWEWDCAQFLLERFNVHVPAPVFNWAKAGHVHRHGLPEEALAQAAPAARTAALKATTDRTWNLTFEDVFRGYGWKTKGQTQVEIEPAVLAQVEALKARQLSALKPKEHIRADSFAGMLNADLKPIFNRQLGGWHRANGFPSGLDGAMRQFKEVIDAALSSFEQRTLGALLPSAALPSELYTLYETASNRRPMNSNDWRDWSHAAAALPHCDFFFTERNLAHLLRQELGADKQYNCKIAGSVDEAAAMLIE